MDRMAKGLLFGAVALSLTAAGCFPAAAASIDRVRIRLTAETLDEMELPVLEAESRDKAYTVTGVERISGDPSNGPAKEGKAEAEEPASEILYEIELECDTGDSFSILRQEDIRFSGLRAVCSKAVRKENGTTLLLTIELQDAGEIVGTVDEAEWAEEGIGRWKKAPGASAYLVMLYCDTKRVGHPHRTRAQQYDFAPLMQEAGVYHFKVMPLTKKEKRGRAAESGWKKVTETEAGQNRDQWGGKEPGWQPEGESPSYILKDGAYPQMDSLLIAERYEQFNENGEKMDES